MKYTQPAMMRCVACPLEGLVTLQFETNEHKARAGHKTRLTRIMTIPAGWTVWYQRCGGDNAISLACPKHDGGLGGAHEVALTDAGICVDGP